MEDKFPEFLDYKTKNLIEEEFRQRERAVVRRKDDSWLTWRREVNYALSEEGVAAVWSPHDDFLNLTPLWGGTSEETSKVPIVHMRDLWMEDASPRAVAAYLKAVIIDGRFKLWRYESEDD